MMMMTEKLTPRWVFEFIHPTIDYISALTFRCILHLISYDQCEL